jgi:hypothetical protein
MRGWGRRKTTPEVKDGQVQTKHRRAASLDDNDVLAASGLLALEARAPGVRHRHVVTERDLHHFFPCIPDWDRHRAGLRAIVLDHDPGCFGSYDHRGIIRLSSWEDDLFVTFDPAFVTEHRATFDRIGIPHDADTAADGHAVAVYFDAWTARAFQLVHVFVHELGHHVDRMMRRRRGEDFAEAWALDLEARVWPRFRARFGR